MSLSVYTATLGVGQQVSVRICVVLLMLLVCSMCKNYVCALWLSCVIVCYVVLSKHAFSCYKFTEKLLITLIPQM